MMGQTVYADVLFLVNFSMDFLVLYISARLLRKRLKPLRAAIGAAIGGVYGVVALIIPKGGFLTFLGDIAVLCAICAIAFAERGEKFRDFIGRCALFAGVSAILGGIMTSLYSTLNRLGWFGVESGEGDDISVWLFALLACAGSAAALAGGRHMRRVRASKNADVVITVNGKEVRIRGMTDTGNLLTDPLGGRAVMLCELDAVESLFPSKLVDVWRGGDVSRAVTLDSEIAASLRFIPAKGALGGRITLLAAVAPDKITVETDTECVEADVLIAPVPYRLSAGGSRVLIPPGII